MALYHKWDDKNAFTFALQFFMLISDSLGGVTLNHVSLIQIEKKHHKYCNFFENIGHSEEGIAFSQKQQDTSPSSIF